MQTSLKNLYQLSIVFSVMTITGTILLLLRFLSFGSLLEFNRKYGMVFSSKLIMRLVGIKLDLPKDFILPQQPTFITFNHNSYLDIFALTAMGMGNTRFMLSEKTIKIIPVTLSAIGIAVSYIPQKKHQSRRLAYFKRFEEQILKEKFHVAGASEGVHDHQHRIDEFNRGVYHMATVCKMNIIPLFIWVPEESNPFNKYRAFKRGVIKIEVMETIDTSNWRLEDLDINKENVRNKYIERFNFYNQK